MTPPSKMVSLPESQYKQLEERASRLADIERDMDLAGKVLKGFNITGVLTLPQSGPMCFQVLEAVRALVRIATTMEPSQK